MLGLGFDGSYKRNKADILDIMKKCSEKINIGPDFNMEKICPDIILEKDFDTDKSKKKDLLRTSKFWLLFFCAFAFISFVINWITFASSISSYVDAVDNTAAAAMSKSSVKNTDLYNELVEENSDTNNKEKSR
jgi:cytoskeletal protein RodZ